MTAAWIPTDVGIARTFANVGWARCEARTVAIASCLVDVYGVCAWLVQHLCNYLVNYSNNHPKPKPFDRVILYFFH